MGLINFIISGRERIGVIAAASVLVIALLVIAGCGGGQEQGTSTSEETVLADTGGKLQITERDYDFGKVPVGQMVEHQFALKNTGSGPLSFGQMSVKRLDGC